MKEFDVSGIEELRVKTEAEEREAAIKTIRLLGDAKEAGMQFADFDDLLDNWDGTSTDLLDLVKDDIMDFAFAETFGDYGLKLYTDYFRQ